MAETKSAFLVFYERILPNKNYPPMLAGIYRPIDICATSLLRLIRGNKNASRARTRGNTRSYNKQQGCARARAPCIYHVK